ncbi:MAG: hypothetical protein MUP11_14030 [Anaerolineales bacterium]|nr:hypothetical protein [Anaerolineales bacterium]
MKIRNILLICLFVFVMAACNLPGSDSEAEIIPSETSLPAVINPTAAATDPPPSATPNILDIEPPAPGTIVLDFAAQVCSAEWSNNTNFLPCPGHLEDLDNGYVEATDHSVLEGMTSVEAPLVIGLPGKGGGGGVGVGLFGHYPPLLVYPGDIFKATIACQGDAACDLEFSLEYFDAWGKFLDTSWSWTHKSGAGPQEIIGDLSALAGQTVDFTLVLRAQEELENQWGVWIQPVIIRDPAAQPLPTQEIQPTLEAESGDKTPGVISGMVAMQTAPPYLNDPGTGNSTPVAVVFFNQDDGTYWWIHTSLTGHPYYQMTVPPGNYQVVAYAHGTDIVPYVSAGYTGQNPSCGKNLKTVIVPPNGKVENIVIADWNWTCGGTAYRPAKPGGVPLP